MARLVLCDVEANGLDPTLIHFIRVKIPSTGFVKTFFDMYDFTMFAKEQPTKWVFHNGLGYDVWVINKLVYPDLIDPKDIVDTMVVSKLVNYTKFITHSLKELGEYLGVYKGDYTGGWDVCTPEMITYGEQDVEVLEAVFNHYSKYVYDKGWAKAMRVEHDMAIICHDMQKNGFSFNIPVAEVFLDQVSAEMKLLEDSFQTTFPPQLVEVNRIKNRVTKGGEPYATVTKALESYPMTRVEGEELVCFDYKAFNPGSSIDRIDVLWDSGWKPTEMTKGHKKFLRESKK